MAGLRKEVFLVHHEDQQTIGSKLPSNLQAFRVLLYNMRYVKLSLRSSAHLVEDEVKIFWAKASLPVRDNPRCVNKLEALHKEYRNLQKHPNSRTENQVKKETEFLEKLKMLFDIAPQTLSEDPIVSEEAKIFLANQRLKNRGRCLMPVRTYFDEKQRQVEIVEYRKKRAHEEIDMLNICVELASSTISSESSRTLNQSFCFCCCRKRSVTWIIEYSKTSKNTRSNRKTCCSS